MTSHAATDITTARHRTAIGGIFARLAGVLLDLGILGLFLVLGVAVLDILVKTIVLIVGYVRAHASAREIQLGIIDWDPGRHASDWTGLGLAVGATIVAFIVFKLGLKLRRYLLSKLIDASFESFVSKRYLISRSGGSLVNLITVISVLGVAVGVTALIVVISVMEGFDRAILTRMLGVFGHVEVWPSGIGQGDEFTEEEGELIIEAGKLIPGYEAAAPAVRRQTIIQADRGTEAQRTFGLIYGIDPERESAVTRLTRFASDDVEKLMDPAAALDLPPLPVEDWEIVLGIEMARQLGVRPGSEIFALGKMATTARGPTPKIIPLSVKGLFKTGLHDVDSSFAYTNLYTSQQIQLTQGQVSIVRFAIEDPRYAIEFGEQLSRGLPSGVIIRPWQEMNREFFEALQTEKVAMFIILLMIVLVASLNIIGTLVMVVTQKTREIGILKSMGATRGMILRIFLYHGFFIGVVGTSLGTACGWWLCRFVRNDIELIFQLPAAVYGLDRLPVEFDPFVVGFLAGCSLLICLIAGIIPALRAARFDPVEALRYS